MGQISSNYILKETYDGDKKLAQRGGYTGK
jgi:hypothetical protein